MDYVDRIREALKKPGKTQRGLSLAISNDSTITNKIIKRVRKMQDNEFRLASQYLGVSLEWLLTGVGKEEISFDFIPRNGDSQEAHVQPKTAPYSFGPDTVPILGQANASSKATILNYDEPIGEALRHPNQKGVKNAFYLMIYDESMSPRYYPGERAAVNGGSMPIAKSDCIIELNNGEVYIKQFVKTTAKEVICSQLNPKQEWKRLLSDIKAIHAVVGRG